jgi:hypothetical protein
MIKVIRARSIDTGLHQFSVIVSDNGITYVFPKDMEMFDSKNRFNLLMKKYGPMDKKTKMTADDYLKIAFMGLTYFKYEEPVEAKIEGVAISAEKKLLNSRAKNYKESETYSSSYAARSADVQQVLEDYPDLYTQLTSTDPDEKITAEGMKELVMAALGSVDPNGPGSWILDVIDGKEVSDEDITPLVFGGYEQALTAAVEPDVCPPATKDIVLNIKNRQNAIDNIGYGPLNPEEPNDKFWQGKADRWNVTIEEAKTSRCGNCAAFIQTSKMKACIADTLQEGDKNVADSYDVVAAGDLGYCEALDFKCAAARTCDAWIAGGPVTDETRKEQE